jgi:hypothetical protein
MGLDGQDEKRRKLHRRQTGRRGRLGGIGGARTDRSATEGGIGGAEESGHRVRTEAEDVLAPTVVP